MNCSTWNNSLVHHAATEVLRTGYYDKKCSRCHKASKEQSCRSHTDLLPTKVGWYADEQMTSGRIALHGWHSPPYTTVTENIVGSLRLHVDQSK